MLARRPAQPKYIDVAIVSTMNYQEFIEAAKSKHCRSVKAEIEKLDASLRPSQALIDGLASKSVEQLYDDLLDQKLYETVKDKLPSNPDLEWDWDWDDIIPSGKTLCIIASTAVAAAIVAAWVASGGTLTIAILIGQWALSFEVASAVYAALIAGGGVAAVASAMC